MTARRWSIVAAGAVGLALAAVGWWAPWRPAATATPAPAAPAVPTTTIGYGIFVERIAAHGRVGPPAGSDAKLAFAGSGILARIDVAVGERVTRGTPLAEYGGADVARAELAAAQARAVAAGSRLRALLHGTGSVQSDRTAAQTALDATQARMTLDNETLAREQQLFRSGVAAEKDVQAASEQVALDRSQLEANEARLRASLSGIGDALTQARSDYESALSDTAVAQRNLENTTLRAPSGGVVVALLKHVGEAVDPSTPTIELGPISGDTVTLIVAGPDGRRVRPGAPVALTDTTLGSRGNGQVIGVVPSVDPATQDTTVVVSGIPSDALNGDAVDASIAVGRRRGIVIPSSAIVTDPESGASLVFVESPDNHAPDAFVPRPVRVIANDDRQALVEGSIQPGERIATEGAFDLLAPGNG